MSVKSMWSLLHVKDTLRSGLVGNYRDRENMEIRGREVNFM